MEGVLFALIKARSGGEAHLASRVLTLESIGRSSGLGCLSLFLFPGAFRRFDDQALLNRVRRDTDVAHFAVNQRGTFPVGTAKVEPNPAAFKVATQLNRGDGFRRQLGELRRSGPDH